MRIEPRTTFGVRSLILVAESEDESLLIDSVLGSDVDEEGLIAELEGELRLSDGYAEHYIRLTKKGK